jgi:hypothetical protein
MIRNKYPNTAYLLLLALLGVLVQAGCTAGDPRFTAEDPAGFLQGLWHGIIAVVAFIISLFSDNVQVYETDNNGAWYDLGFLIGVICIWGGGAKAHAKNRKCRQTDAEWEEVARKVEKKVKRELGKFAEDDTDESERTSDVPKKGDAAASDKASEDEWEEIGKKIEEKIKRKLKKWAEEE